MRASEQKRLIYPAPLSRHHKQRIVPHALCRPFFSSTFVPAVPATVPERIGNVEHTFVDRRNHARVSLPKLVVYSSSKGAA